MTGLTPPSFPTFSPMSAGSDTAGNCRKTAGFYPDFPELVRAIPATKSCNQGNSIYELDFGRFYDRDSGHFRSVFGGRSLEPRFGDFPAKGNRFGPPRAAGACGGEWAL
ncbi:unnamed protein product [Prunus brigantina]